LWATIVTAANLPINNRIVKEISEP
jgi:hypothetical protein